MFIKKSPIEWVQPNGVATTVGWRVYKAGLLTPYQLERIEWDNIAVSKFHRSFAPASLKPFNVLRLEAVHHATYEELD